MIYNNNKNFDYIIEEEKDVDVEKQTIFKLKKLSARQMAILQSSGNFSKEDGALLNPITFALEACKSGIAGWDNFKDGDGNLVKFNPRDLESNMEKLPVSVISEIGTKVFTVSMLGESEIKN